MSNFVAAISLSLDCCWQCLIEKRQPKLYRVKRFVLKANVSHKIIPLIPNTATLLLFLFYKYSLREKFPHSEFFCSIFYHIWTVYKEILQISPYSFRIWKNTDQKNSIYGHFSHRDLTWSKISIFFNLRFFLFITLFKSSPLKVFCEKKSILKNFEKFTGKQLPGTLLKINATTDVFCLFWNFFQNNYIIDIRLLF